VRARLVERITLPNALFVVALQRAPNRSVIAFRRATTVHFAAPFPAGPEKSLLAGGFKRFGFY
jgi:hypothetical protein